MVKKKWVLSFVVVLVRGVVGMRWLAFLEGSALKLPCPAAGVSKREVTEVDLKSMQSFVEGRCQGGFTLKRWSGRGRRKARNP